jgi:pyruvate,orthophosphate dikinase
MPGMLDTVLDVGVTEDGVASLIRRTGNPWLAWDAYRRLIRSFAATVYRLPGAPFDRLAAEIVARAGARSLQELDPVALRDLTQRSRKLLESLSPAPLPADPLDQLIAAVHAVFSSWQADKAREYRRLNGLSDDTGTGVLIQAMVFGDAGARSGAGVGFTRNPATGDDSLYVDFAFNAQGEDIVSGRCALTESAVLSDVLPEVWRELLAAKAALEREFLDTQEFEFTVEEGRLYFLQSRTAKRTARAAVQIASDLVRDGFIDVATALERVAAYDLKSIVTTVVRPRAGDVRLASAIPASIGVASGRVAFDVQRARELAADGPVILVRHELTTDDFGGLVVAAGIVTTFGGRTSHAAVLARQLGKVCLVGCRDLEISADARACVLGGRRLREGDTITIDGESGWIYADAVSARSEVSFDALAIVEEWRRAQAVPIDVSLPDARDVVR